jgi:hypothetical protein
MWSNTLDERIVSNYRVGRGEDEQLIYTSRYPNREVQNNKANVNETTY